MKIAGWRKNAVYSKGPFSANPQGGQTLPAPAKDLFRAESSTYGGPPGAFISSSTCPSGYSSVPLSTMDAGRTETRCVPKPRASVVQPVPPPSAPSMTVSPSITVSPVMQQSFTPQFAPVMQQQQDSPGAVQEGTPTQTATTSQTADTGVRIADPARARTEPLSQADMIRQFGIQHDPSGMYNYARAIGLTASDLDTIMGWSPGSAAAEMYRMGVPVLDATFYMPKPAPQPAAPLYTPRIQIPDYIEPARVPREPTPVAAPIIDNIAVPAPIIDNIVPPLSPGRDIFMPASVVTEALQEKTNYTPYLIAAGILGILAMTNMGKRDAL